MVTAVTCNHFQKIKEERQKIKEERQKIKEERTDWCAPLCLIVLAGNESG
jgi:hypothetical protein